MARCPVVPVAIQGTREALPPGAWFPRPVKITAMVGEPMWLPPVLLAPDNKPILQKQANAVMDRIYEMVAIMEQRSQKQPNVGTIESMPRVRRL